MPDLEIDHYLFYEVAPWDIALDAAFQGQFDDGFDAVEAGVRDRIGIPVVKRPSPDLPRYPLKRRHSLFTMYLAPSHSTGHPRAVTIENQFGKSELELGPAERILVPALPLFAPGGTPPRPPDFDHFKVYRAHGKSVDRTVHVTTPYSDAPTRVGEPRFFAVPSAKRRGGEPDSPQIGNDHLTIYDIEPLSAVHVDVEVMDQFERLQHELLAAILLAVPTEKTDVHWT